MSDVNLKPCPFCGGKADFDYDDSGYNWVFCKKCGVSTDTRMHDHEDARLRLSEDWNQRDKAALQQSIAELKAEAAHQIAMMVRQDYGHHMTYNVSLLCSGLDGYANSFEREAKRVKDGE